MNCFNKNTSYLFANEQSLSEVERPDMIVILVLMFAAVADAGGDYGADLTAIAKKFPGAAAAVIGMDTLFKTFDCSRGAEGKAACDVWTAGVLVEKLDENKPNCDATPTSEECKQARQIVNDSSGSMSQADLIAKLTTVTKKLFDDKVLTAKLNAIWGGMVEYVCFKEPASCSTLKYLKLLCTNASPSLLFHHFTISPFLLFHHSYYFTIFAISPCLLFQPLILLFTILAISPFLLFQPLLLLSLFQHFDLFTIFPF